MSPSRAASTAQLLWVGVTVLLTTPAAGSLSTGELANTEFRAEAGNAAAIPDTEHEALKSDDPIEQIYWLTRDVVVPRVEKKPPWYEPGLGEDEPLAIEDGQLDDIRGGFEFADANLKVSFGIERAVFVNGQLVASNVLNFNDLQWTSGTGTTPELSQNNAGSAISVIQNGPGNNISAQLGATLAGTIIQNTLNDQKIQNITTINASLNSAQLMRSITLQSAVQDAIVNSLRR